MKRAMLFIALVLILTTGCQSQEAPLTGGVEGENETAAVSNTIADSDFTVPSNAIPVETGVDTNTDASVDTAADTDSNINISTAAEENLINSLDDLYKSMHTLKIQKSGESTVYDAARPLVLIFGDMLSKVEEVYTDTPEGNERIKDLDYDHFDYRLKFDGAKDILFTREGNTLCFEGEKKVYYLWGSADSLWDSLIFNNGNKTVDIDREIVQLMSNAYSADVDGDGKAERIELVYERGKTEDFRGNLIIRVNGSESVVIEGDEWYTKPYRTIGQMPELEFLQDKNGKSKALLVIYSWATNGIGSTGIINAYRYANGSISEVKVKDAEGIIKYEGNNTVSIDFPALNKNMEFMIDIEELVKVFGDEDSVKQELEADHIRKPHPFFYGRRL